MLKLKVQYFGQYWYEELSHWKRPWCWERLKAGREGDDRGWDGWMVSLTQWAWVWVNSGSRWWTGRPGVLQSMGLQRVGYKWTTELNWKPAEPLLFSETDTFFVECLRILRQDGNQALTFASQKTLKVLFPGARSRKVSIHPVEVVIRHHVVLGIPGYVDHLEAERGRGEAKPGLEQQTMMWEWAYSTQVGIPDAVFLCCGFCGRWKGFMSICVLMICDQWTFCFCFYF